MEHSLVNGWSFRSGTSPLIIDDNPMTEKWFLIGILDFWQFGSFFGPQSHALSRLFLLLAHVSHRWRNMSDPICFCAEFLQYVSRNDAS